MKTAIYVENGIFQVVLTPESDLEKMALEKLRDLDNVVSYQGTFAECRGGYIRQYQGEKESTIFVCRKKEENPNE